MTATPDSLAPQFREDPTVEPPYSNAQISETAIHREILRIYQSARRETRAVYDLGRDTDRVEEENWVIRWMLWHVFRYRDNRNKNRRAVSPGDGDSGGAPSPENTGVSPTSQPGTQRALTTHRRRVLDANEYHRSEQCNNAVAVLGSSSQRLAYG